MVSALPTRAAEGLERVARLVLEGGHLAGLEPRNDFQRAIALGAVGLAVAIQPGEVARGAALADIFAGSRPL